MMDTILICELVAALVLIILIIIYLTKLNKKSNFTPLNLVKIISSNNNDGQFTELYSPSGNYIFRQFELNNDTWLGVKNINTYFNDIKFKIKITNYNNVIYKQQTDGNFVIYNDEGTLYASNGGVGTSSGPFTLTLGDDGIMKTLDNKNKVVWKSTSGMSTIKAPRNNTHNVVYSCNNEGLVPPWTSEIGWTNPWSRGGLRIGAFIAATNIPQIIQGPSIGSNKGNNPMLEYYAGVINNQPVTLSYYEGGKITHVQSGNMTNNKLNIGKSNATNMYQQSNGNVIITGTGILFSSDVSSKTSTSKGPFRLVLDNKGMLFTYDINNNEIWRWTDGFKNHSTTS